MLADRREEVVVGRQNGAVHRELDDGLRLADGLDLLTRVRGFDLCGGHVRGKVQDFAGLAGTPSLSLLQIAL